MGSGRSNHKSLENSGGATLAEYVVLLAAIMFVCFVAIATTGEGVRDIFRVTTGALEDPTSLDPGAGDSSGVIAPPGAVVPPGGNLRLFPWNSAL